MGNSGSEDKSDLVGYRVLGVQENSPAAQGGLVSFFDFIVAANGIPLKTLDSTFIDLIKASEDQPLPLQIYNWKNKTLREITLTPSKNWPGEGMLGVTIRFDTFKDAEEQMLHVLEVEPNSPAELAGLQPFKDYLLGTAEKAFVDAEVLSVELLDHLEKPVEFYVYNTDTDEVRVVVLMPSEDWGGDGILGANVAYGYLHVLPAHCCETIGVSNAGEAGKGMSSPFGQNQNATIADGADSSGLSAVEAGNPSSELKAVPLPTAAPTGTSTSSSVAENILPPAGAVSGSGNIAVPHAVAPANG
mmetsp:Transcript_16823/g.28537  ORF Transcript_16823/g.28537 Transcript_16823/m.28537 type:complete len:302 (-) Transcript_16823:1123-2028(-)|eukprot:CAMPEP_0175020148 /NCGR_PEP_ID=MMETSP0005-20121125/13964_1 /TAXON_ID=420556 /ORGANISM="Ochromonas sp., Strain CCMP1393" /LENGTH=301 /DNA_ID=CAMNT_0016277985 /DNA_START=118 /DNA_END=1023 /DNA_ORIENTATION=+